MADTGSPYNLRYPLSSSPVNIHTDIQNLANDAETALDTKLNKTGGTLTGALSGTTLSLSGNITVSATGTAQIRAASSTGYARFNADRASGQYGALYVLTGGSTRWLIGGNSTAESGSNAGTNFVVKAYDDSGVHIDDHLLITRATGKVHLGQVGATAGLELGTSGPRMMSGTGSPEGSVTAPVGSIWFQSDSTVGVTHWRKATGSGNTGWVVMNGDTGLRNMSGVSLLNGWTVGARLYLRRHGNVVTFNGDVNASASTNDVFYNLPVGFRPTDWEYHAVAVTTSTYKTYEIGDAGNVRAYNRGTATSNTFALTWITSDPWPTSLPGS